MPGFFLQGSCLFRLLQASIEARHQGGSFHGKPVVAGSNCPFVELSHHPWDFFASFRQVYPGIGSGSLSAPQNSAGVEGRHGGAGQVTLGSRVSLQHLADFFQAGVDHAEPVVVTLGGNQVGVLLRFLKAGGRSFPNQGQHQKYAGDAVKVDLAFCQTPFCRT